MQAGYLRISGIGRGIIIRMKTEMNCNPLIIATGDYAGLIGENTKMIDRVDPNLTLQGLRYIHELNK